MQRFDQMNISSPLDLSNISLDVFSEQSPQKILNIA
jgi:hypothetical protein